MDRAAPTGPTAPRSPASREPGEPGGRVDLVAEGLDTVARIELNGALVGETRDMHRTHRFDVTGLVRPGENQLTVAFRAPLDAAEEAAAALGPRPHVNPHPYNALRKNASSYGWDWGPDLPTAGIWRPIRLESWSTARLAGVRPLVDVRPTAPACSRCTRTSRRCAGPTCGCGWRSRGVP